MNAQISPEARRAALLVHALPLNDRAWLLESLQPMDRAPLEALLAELQALGIPGDERLVDQALDVPVTAAPCTVQDRLNRLDAAQLRLLARALQREGPVLAARLLAAHEWPWKATLSAHWEAGFAKQAREAALAQPAPVLAAAVCEAALRELHSLQQQAPIRRSRWAWRKLWSRQRWQREGV
jgi:hypothetical protein